MYGPYQLYGSSQDNLALPTSFYASIANRVSYALNFHGPSLAVDTMCSSSLTAIHLACESIRRGECEAAIAGGVNIASHPSKYLVLSQGRFLSLMVSAKALAKEEMAMYQVKGLELSY